MAIYQSKEWKGVYAEPKHDIDPKLKQNDPKFSLQFCKYIYDRFYQNNAFPYFGDFNKIDILRDYAKGKQSGEIYAPLLDVDSENTAFTSGSQNSSNPSFKREGYMHIDFENIFSPAPKLMRKVIGSFLNQRHRITCNAIDKLSGAKKEAAKLTTKFQNKLNPAINNIKGTLGIPTEQDVQLESDDEIELYSQLKGFKLPYELAGELLLKHTDDISQEIEQYKKILFDLCAIGIAAKISYIDDSTGKAKYKYVDIKNCVIEYSDQDGFDNSRYCAVQEYITIGELRIQLPEYPEEKLQELAFTYKGSFGNPNNFSTNYNRDENTYDYYCYKVPVLKCYMRSTDTYYKGVNYKISKYLVKKKEVEAGKIIEVDGNYYKSKQTDQIDYQVEMIYQASWPIGSDIVYKYGLMTDIPRQEPGCMLPVVAYKINEKSIVESIIPLLDNIELAYLRFQNAWAMAAPPGMAVDISKLVNVCDVVDGIDNVLDVMKMYLQTGRMLYSSEDNKAPHLPGANISAGYPFVELQGGLKTAVEDFSKTLVLNYQSISVLTGIDMISAGFATPNADTTVGVQEMALSATTDALRPFYSAYLFMRKRIAEINLSRIQTIVTHAGKETPYDDVVSEYQIEALKTAGKSPAAKFGINVEPLPTDKMMAVVEQAAQVAISAGTMTMPEYLILMDNINSTGNYKAGIAFISYRQNKAEQDKAQQAMALEKMKSEQLAAMETLKTDNLMKIDSHKAELDLIKAFYNNQFRMQQNAQKQQLKGEQTILDEALTRIPGGEGTEQKSNLADMVNQLQQSAAQPQQPTQNQQQV